MSEWKEYKLSFGGVDYILESRDGGVTGSVFEHGADRWEVSYAYKYDDVVKRFHARIAEGADIVLGEELEGAEKPDPTAEQVLTALSDLLDPGAARRRVLGDDQ